MRSLPIIIGATILGTSLIGCARPHPATVPSSPPPARTEMPAEPIRRVDSLEAILSDQRLWGRDFPSALAYLKSWEHAGEREIFIFQKFVMGRTAYKDAAAVQRVRDELARATRAQQPRPRAEFTSLLAGAQRQPAPFRADTARFYEDALLHAVWAPEGAVELQAPDLTIALVRSRLGAPEDVRRIAVEGAHEARPSVLTMHSYAQGTVVFVESDFAVNPDRIDRVILSVTPAVRVLFGEGP
jgi:hypothetical protein